MNGKYSAGRQRGGETIQNDASYPLPSVIGFAWCLKFCGSFQKPHSNMTRLFPIPSPSSLRQWAHSKPAHPRQWRYQSKSWESLYADSEASVCFIEWNYFAWKIMVRTKVEIMLYTCLDIKIYYASAAIWLCVSMHQVPIVLRKFIRIAARQLA